jgi:hypothetical protein
MSVDTQLESISPVYSTETLSVWTNSPLATQFRLLSTCRFHTLIVPQSGVNLAVEKSGYINLSEGNTVFLPFS